MRLWGSVNIPAIFPQQYSLAEFCIPSEHTGKSFTLGSACGMTSASEIPPFRTYKLNKRASQETTFCFDIAAQTWQSFLEIPHQDQPTKLTVSSYNVLFELESIAPIEERYPLLVSSIISEHANAGIITLQEVTDSFLSYLLSSKDIRERYGFVSHGPPTQSDIGPLLSLCNIVILSRYPFTWGPVRFQEKHKEVVIATLRALPGNGQYDVTLPLVVTGVHFTCGLTEAAIASKQLQLTTLRKHLPERYPASPWIIAGDFNFPTFSYTINNARIDKLIAKHSTETLYNMEASLIETGLLDAWTVTRTGIKNGVPEQYDDLYDGEHGVTFNPRTNRLAAITCRTSSNRPQQYDRILLRPHGCLEMESFTLFGLPQERGSIQTTPNDHFGVRATIQIADNNIKKLPSDTKLPARSAVLWKHSNGLIADTESLKLASKNHNMFPSETEIAHHGKAFSIVKEILLVNPNKNEVPTGGISLAVVAVGSYALETWTSASDIDCLCVGTASSKNFFELARKRIAEANDKGAYTLRTVEARTGTMFELLVYGVHVDLQYCPAAQLANRLVLSLLIFAHPDTDCQEFWTLIGLMICSTYQCSVVET